jgi:hypothetical protein
MMTVLLIVLVLIMVGALPQAGVYQGGYFPSGIVGVVVLVLVILLLLGRL